MPSMIRRPSASAIRICEPVKPRREQLAFARTRVANGLVGGIDVLQAALRWRQTQDARVQSDRRLEMSPVRLLKAVGGGVSEEGRSATEPSAR